MTEAVFKAAYADWKLIKTRKVVQICFELPLETADLAYRVLGGMPNPAAETWCAVARLNPVVGAAASAAGLSTTLEKRETQGNPGGGHVTEPSLEPLEKIEDALDEPTPRRPRKPVNPDKRLAQRAAILCGDPVFLRYLIEDRGLQTSTMTPAEFVREFCNVLSRADIKPNTEAGRRWDLLESAFRIWEAGPRYV